MIKKSEYKILIYDNLDHDSTLVYDYMLNYGYSCINSNNIKHLEEILKTTHIDLIIINSNKANKEVVALLEKINNITFTKIVFITSCTDRFIRDNFLFLNIVDYKIKFNNLFAILSDVNRLIKRLIKNRYEKVLLIQKDEFEREYLENLLKLRGYDLAVASNGNQGWKEIDKIDNLSMLFVDINIAGIECIDIINKAKMKYDLDIPIISFASKYDFLALQQLASNGLSYFFKLPISVEEFNLKTDLLIDNLRQKREIEAKKKQLEQNLKSFQALANATIEALIMFEENICVDANEEAIKMFGFESKEDFLGTHILKILPEDIQPYDKQEILKNDVNHEFELNMKKHNGKIFPAHIKERNLILENRMLKIIAVLDLTEIKRKESLLHQQSKMAAMGEMMANIAHQWRQPLAAISVAASGIKLNYELGLVEEEELFEQLDTIIDSTEFLSNTINDFQNFLSKDRVKEDFNIVDSIKQVLKIIEGNLKKEKIVVIENYNANLLVHGFKNESIQAILNIVNNAKDALESKKHQKVILIESYIDRQKNIVLKIQDNAGGISENIIDNIFEPYFTTKHKSQGVGLGLYMTHQIIVDHMNGKLEVANKELSYNNETYIGAEFKITLPVA